MDDEGKEEGQKVRTGVDGESQTRGKEWAGEMAWGEKGR